MDIDDNDVNLNSSRQNSHQVSFASVDTDLLRSGPSKRKRGQISATRELQAISLQLLHCISNDEKNVLGFKIYIDAHV